MTDLGERCSVAGCNVAGPYRVGAFFTLCPSHLAAWAQSALSREMVETARQFLIIEAEKLKR